MDLLKEDQEYLLPVYNRIPLEIERGEGLYLYDKEGKAYLDTYAGIAVNTLGHQHPKVVKAIRDQAEKFLHLSNYFAVESATRLARILFEQSFASKVFFANSGTEANEAMLKLAKKFGRSIRPEKTNFVALEKGFHGRTTGSLSLTANSRYKEMFEPNMPGVTHVPLNDSQALEAAVDENTCGIIFEVIQGEGGLAMVSPAFVEKINELAARYDALILVDEVQTGLMRTGKLFAYEHLDLVPDALTTAKGLGGGMPLGALLVSERLENVFQAGDHGSTFGPNPVAAAAGAAVLEIITDRPFQEHVCEVSKYLWKGLRDLQLKHPQIISDIRGKGLMIGLETGVHAAGIKERALEKGVLLNVTSGTVVRLLPALIIEEKDCDLLLQVLDNILTEQEASYATAHQ